MAQIKTGDKIQDFTLENQNGKKINTADLKGQKTSSFLSSPGMDIGMRGADEKPGGKLRRSSKNSDTVPLGITIDTAPPRKRGRTAWG